MPIVMESLLQHRNLSIALGGGGGMRDLAFGILFNAPTKDGSDFRLDLFRGVECWLEWPDDALLDLTATAPPRADWLLVPEMFKLDEVGSEAMNDFARTARNLNSWDPLFKQNADGKQYRQKLCWWCNSTVLHKAKMKVITDKAIEAWWICEVLLSWKSKN